MDSQEMSHQRLVAVEDRFCEDVKRLKIQTA
jgi:hypothetical protein